MRLSDAILLGSTMSKQIRGQYSSDEGTCALGTAAIGVGVRPATIEIERAFPGVLRSRNDLRCPACKRGESGAFGVLGFGIGGMVIHLNDHHEWTRERIAEWVRTVEPAETIAEARIVTEDSPITVSR